MKVDHDELAACARQDRVELCGDAHGEMHSSVALSHLLKATFFVDAMCSMTTCWTLSSRARERRARESEDDALRLREASMNSPAGLDTSCGILGYSKFEFESSKTTVSLHEILSGRYARASRRR